MTDEIALHEAGHIVACHALGWTPGAVTIEPGTVAEGCALFVAPRVDPDELAALRDCTDAALPTWPATLRGRIERELLVTLAGPVAAELFAPRARRVADRARERLPEPTPAERKDLAGTVSNPATESDDQIVERLCRVAHPGDVQSAVALRTYMAVVCRALLLRHYDRLMWIALVLFEEQTLSAGAVATLLADSP